MHTVLIAVEKMILWIGYYSRAIARDTTISGYEVSGAGTVGRNRVCSAQKHRSGVIVFILGVPTVC